MPATPNPKIDLRDFLRDSFDPNAVSVPWTNSEHIGIANYDVGPEFPSIAIANSDPVIPGGGDTGVTAIDGQGGGGIQESVFHVLVDCWGGPRDDPTYEEHGSDPETVAGEIGEEVHSETMVGVLGAPDGYEWMWSNPPKDANQSEATPTELRRQVTVRMKWTYLP